MEMKYIVVEFESRDAQGKHEVPILFANIIAHKGMYDSVSLAYRRYDHNCFIGNVLSAGFVSIDGNGKVTCWGESESLGGVKSRPARDALLISHLQNNWSSTNVNMHHLRESAPLGT